MKNLKSDSSSKLLVIGHEINDFETISQVLSHYFPNPQSQHSLFISNKYYRANVDLMFKTWNQAQNYRLLNNQNQNPTGNQQKESEQVQEQNTTQEETQKSQTLTKYDLMIMLVDQKQQNDINFQLIDQIIDNYNPEEFVLLINTLNPSQPWVHEETILEKCNNFIQIVKEDLFKINKQKPHWNRGALLNNQEESDDSGIFSILDRLETTRWTTMVSVKKEDSLLGGNAKKQENNQNKQEHFKTLSANFNDIKNEVKPQAVKQEITAKTNQVQVVPKQQPQVQTHEKQPQRKHSSSSEQQQVDEKRLQEEMREFENMMSQMMSFKVQAAGMKNEERKQKAEQLFASMFKGMMNQFE